MTLVSRFVAHRRFKERSFQIGIDSLKTPDPSGLFFDERTRYANNLLNDTAAIKHRNHVGSMSALNPAGQTCASDFLKPDGTQSHIGSGGDGNESTHSVRTPDSTRQLRHRKLKSRRAHTHTIPFADPIFRNTLSQCRAFLSRKPSKIITISVGFSGRYALVMPKKLRMEPPRCSSKRLKGDVLEPHRPEPLPALGLRQRCGGVHGATFRPGETGGKGSGRFKTRRFSCQ